MLADKRNIKGPFITQDEGKQLATETSCEYIELSQKDMNNLTAELLKSKYLDPYLPKIDLNWTPQNTVVKKKKKKRFFFF